MLRINLPFVAHIITQKKMHSSVIVDIVSNTITYKKKSIIVNNIGCEQRWSGHEKKKYTKGCIVGEKKARTCKQVMWTGKKSKISFGANVFVFAISMMNWVFFLPSGLCMLRCQHPHCLYLTSNKQVAKINGQKPFQFHSVKERQAGFSCGWTWTLWDAFLQIVNHDVSPYCNNNTLWFSTHCCKKLWAVMLQKDTVHIQYMHTRLQIVGNNSSFLQY